MAELDEFQRDLLYVMAGRKRPRGRAIKRELETYYGQRVGYERVYPHLDLLVNEGFVKEADDQPTRYLLTRRGWREIELRHS